MLNIVGIIVPFAALTAWLVNRYTKLPMTIGLMAISLVVSLFVIGAGELGFNQMEIKSKELLMQIDFNEIVIQWMLGILLFAGALHIELERLFSHKWVILFLATVGVVISTVSIGFAVKHILHFLTIEISYTYSFLFGALISPTDPIAVLSIMKKMPAISKDIQTKIAGESLFNDGVAIVVFTVVLGLVTENSVGNNHLNLASLFFMDFIQEAVGGIILGMLCGWLGYLFIKTTDNYLVEVMLTLGVVFGGTSLASVLHVSGPLALAIAGLLIGNRGRMLAMSERGAQHIDDFWHLLDEMLNAVLFIILGAEILIISFDVDIIIATCLVFIMIILVRWGTIAIPVNLMRFLKREYPGGTIAVMTWGGLRGGVSVALALSIPTGPEREVLLTMTYIIVLMSILGQGLSMGGLLKKLDIKSIK